MQIFWFFGTSSQNDRSFSIVTFIRLKFHRPSKFLATRIITWATSSNDNNLFPLGQQKNWNHGSFLSARPMIIAERKRGGYFLFAGRKRFDVFDPRRNVAKRGLECRHDFPRGNVLRRNFGSWIVLHAVVFSESKIKTYKLIVPSWKHLNTT